MLPDSEYRKQEFLYGRAKNLFLRGRDMLLTGLEQIEPGFLEKLNQKKFAEALSPFGPNNVSFLYWAAAGWLSAFAIDPFDMKLMITLPRAAALMARVEALDPGYRDGAVHDFYTLYYGSIPEYMGGDFQKAREHFEKAVALSEGKSTSPYLSLATTVCVKEQKPDEFRSLLKKVLAIDVDADPANRLLNTLNQRKARWFLDHIDDYFLEWDEEDSSEDQNPNTEEDHQ
jgi:predicted anti-sigma-YlaC factor YlaD